MGMLVNGKWVVQDVNPKTEDGEFRRQPVTFHGTIGGAEFPTEAGRYHLYVSLACPWAHRTLIFRALKGLESLIDVSIVSPDMGDDGWSFAPYPGSTDDKACGKALLREVYLLADPHFTGRVTVPVLWDKQTKRIVNNESSEIIRIFNSAFDDLTGNRLDFYPKALRPRIDEINAFVYDKVNNGVYKAGFARTQAAYERNVRELFAALDHLEQLLSRSPYLAGDRVTEADWRLFTTLVRFDPVYFGHFKCNVRRLADYPNLFNYTKQLYQAPGVAATVDLDQIKRHYYWSHPTINPTRIVPIGPEIDLASPHDRGPLVMG